jgi:hypothetical protein
MCAPGDADLDSGSLKCLSVAGRARELFYAKGVLNEERESELMRWIYMQPWVTLRTRRVQCYGGAPGEVIVLEPLPTAMQELCALVSARASFPQGMEPNHVLVNGALCTCRLVCAESGL